MLNPALEIEDHANTVSLVVAVADYAAAPAIVSDSAIGTARHCLIEVLALGFEALRDPERAALVGPLVPGALMPGGARVPGTSLELDPAQAAFCNGLLLCKAAGGDPQQAASGGRAVDSFGAILAVADYQARRSTMEGKSPPKIRDVLVSVVKALQIQRTLAADDREESATVALRLVRVAATAVVAAQLGGTQGQIVTALSYACIEGETSTSNDGPYDVGRRHWTTADAISRSVRHACQAVTAGHPSYLTAAELKAMDAAGRLLGAKPSAAKPRFGTVTIGPYKPRETAQLIPRFQTAVDGHFPARQAERIKALFATPERLDDLPVNEFLAALVTNGAR